MSDFNRTLTLPARLPSLVLRALPDVGQFVVKNGSGGYYNLDEQSYFLLEHLDGRLSVEQVLSAYEARFAEPLTAEELTEFLETARGLGFLEEAEVSPTPVSPSAENSLLNFRIRLIDPDRLLNWLAPRLWFFWTPAFVVLATLSILLATLVAWDRRADLAGSFLDLLSWRTVVLGWVVVALVTVLHELAHGLTCKHFGGEVSDMGFLMLFFMPCFYANVSDAWLFPRRSQRLWVTFAGGFFELWLWALAVFAWAALQPGTLPHRAAYLVVVLCGVQTLFNFNPLLKLDGYYLLGDWLGLVNLRERALDRLMAWLRCRLWGAAPAEPEPRSRVLLVYGLVSLLYSLAVLAVGLVIAARVGGRHLGVIAWLAVGLLALLSFRTLFRGISQGEVTQMIRTRHLRTGAWLLGLAAGPLALSLVTIPERAGGPARLRPATRIEVRAPVAGFLQQVYADEGETISAGTVLAVLEVPDLASRTEQKRAEQREARARLKLLEAGPRAEEVEQQRRRVARAETWRDLAVRDLERARRALREELIRLDEMVTQRRAEVELASDQLRRLRGLRSRAAVSQEDYVAAENKHRVARALEAQTRAEKTTRQVVGTQTAEAELARRTRELADDRAKLALLEAGSRPEEVEAARARLDRLEAELRHLGRLQARTQVVCRSAGVVVTPRLREKLHDFVKEGDLIAVVEDTDSLEAEVALPEEESARVRVGQRVGLKVRALPHDTFTAEVVRVAPAARVADPEKPEQPGRVTIYCRLAGSVEGLRPGMTGYARIYAEERSVGGYLLDRAVRFIRTEFWW